jgi:hypothetical protein
VFCLVLAFCSNIEDLKLFKWERRILFILE